MTKPTVARLVALALLLTLLAACGGSSPSPGDATGGSGDAADIEARIDEFSPTTIEADLSVLSDDEKQIVDLLISASKRLDPVFMRQANADPDAFMAKLPSITEPRGAALREYAAIQYGPYERQHGWRPYIEGVPTRPDGAGFYPPATTRDSFDAYLESHPDEKDALTSLTTMVVERDGRLVPIPYSEYFADALTTAADELRQAAELSDDPTLKTYLTTLAGALLNDEYTPADMAWMDLAGRIELTYGPYEVYEDELFSYKAAFQSYVTLVDANESERLVRFKQLLPALERNLPIEDQYKNFERGTESPIRVVDLVFSSGDARAGIQAIAFNLPNDETVREAKGSKKVLLRNVIAAKYRAILVPIAQSVMVEDQVPLVAESEFVDFVLHHELSHGLGPGRITVGGETGEVREFLQEHYNVFEEAKADIVGLWNVLHLIERGEMPQTDRDKLLVTYVAGLFRSANFGTASAHGQGAMIQFSLLEELGGVSIEDGKVRANLDALPSAIEEISRQLLMLQALGDKAGAEAMRNERGRPTPSMQARLDSLDGIPVDIRPSYPAAGE